MKTETEKQIYKKPLYEYRQEAERALRTIENLFGSNPWHEHQKIVGFLQGYIAGMNFAERQIEADIFARENEAEK
jgi:hypothetical protein